MRFDERKRYYVYEWYNKETNEIFYVGKGSGKRYLTKTRKDNPTFTKYVNENDCGSRIIKKCLTEEQAFVLEEETIISYKKKGYNLINIQNGGYLPPNLKGVPKSETWKNKTSKSLKEYYQNNPQEKEKISKRMKDFLKTEEGKKFSEKSLISRRTSQFRIEQSKRSIKSNNTEEYKKRQSELVKKMWENEEYRESHIGGNNGRANAVIQFDLNGNEIARFESISLAEINTGISSSTISRVCRGDRKTAGGYTWKYVDNKNTKKMESKLKGVPNKNASKPILQFDMNNNLIKEYDSLAEAVKELNLKSHSNISYCLTGKTKSAYGFKWKYKHDNTVPSL